MAVRAELVRRSGIKYAAPISCPESIEWCAKQFGPPGSVMTGRYTVLQYTIQFRERKDRDWYILRWS